MIYIDDRKGYYINPEQQIVSFYQDQRKGHQEYLDGMSTIPGFIVECEDNHSYLLFAPEMEALKHMRCYYSIIDNAKQYDTDQGYCPFVPCIYPAYVGVYDIATKTYNKKPLVAPVTEMGKIYVLN